MAGLVLAGLLALLLGWRFFQIVSGNDPSRPQGRSRGTSQKVTVDRAEMEQLEFNYEIVGNVESSQTVDIVARAAGLLEEVNVLEGDPVQKGDLLARIDDAQALANLYRVKSELANAKFTYYQLLNQRELTDVQGQSGVEIAQAEMAAARAGVEKSRSAYEATLSQARANVAQANAAQAEAKSLLRQSQVDYNQARVRYERMLGLQRQGFASQADVQDSYADVLSKHAAVEANQAKFEAAKTQANNAREQSEKDAVSARADIETSRTQAASAKATVNQALAETSRSQSFQQQVLAQKSLVESAEAEVKIAQLGVRDTKSHSPVDGFVSDRRLDPGAIVNVGDVILTVQAGGEVWVVASLPQEIYNYVQRDESCRVKIDGMGDRIFDAYIFRKDSAVDASSRQFNIRVKVDDPEGMVKPGMFARVMMTLGPDDPRLMIPSSALTARDEESRTATVYKVVEGKVQVVDVQYGPDDGKKTLIAEGLQEGDVVVVQTARPLKDGQEIETQPARPAPPQEAAAEAP